MEGKSKIILEFDLNQVLTTCRSRQHFEELFQQAGKHDFFKKGYFSLISRIQTAILPFKS